MRVKKRDDVCGRIVWLHAPTGPERQTILARELHVAIAKLPPDAEVWFDYAGSLFPIDLVVLADDVRVILVTLAPRLGE